MSKKSYPTQEEVEKLIEIFNTGKELNFTTKIVNVEKRLEYITRVIEERLGGKYHEYVDIQKVNGRLKITKYNSCILTDENGKRMNKKRVAFYEYDYEKLYNIIRNLLLDHRKAKLDHDIFVHLDDSYEDKKKFVRKHDLEFFKDVYRNFEYKYDIDYNYILYKDSSHYILKPRKPQKIKKVKDVEDLLK